MRKNKLKEKLMLRKMLILQVNLNLLKSQIRKMKSKENNRRKIKRWKIKKRKKSKIRKIKKILM